MQPELTLVVAATRNMGIGANGTMPWKGLRKEMAYFARVTTRASTPGSMNAVIMGRKTWDSIPAKFRPLKDRLNIVISRSTPTQVPSSPVPASEPVRVSSLEQAIQYARENSNIHRVFVMGGAQIYKAAMDLPASKRILLTSLKREFECDTFFPELDQSWKQASADELKAWTGEEADAVDGEREEADTKYEFQMWQRE
ncbi:hypothetical protein Golomagni_07718 [Golovinomyces magnicellulatus]|nr:hypothetical protein Golomagni_07718 [Golovinomyces magnicellulatus]